jgi:hypothetical protein
VSFAYGPWVQHTTNLDNSTNCAEAPRKPAAILKSQFSRSRLLVRASDLSSDRRKLLVPVPGGENIKALLPPPAPRELDAISHAATGGREKAIAATAAVARLLPHPDLITRSLEYEATGSIVGLPDDASTTFGYVRALDHGLRMVRQLGGPRRLNLDFVRQLHRIP